MGWYVVETNPLCEQQVQDRLTAIGPPTLLLRMRRIKRSHLRGASPFVPIFPRYLFTQLELPAERELVGIIKRQPGVKSILGATPAREFPLAVRDADILRLRELSADLEKEIEITNEKPRPLAPDTIVRILWEPFDGQFGKIEFDNGIRADVLLAAAGVVRKLNLPRELIEAAVP